MSTGRMEHRDRIILAIISRIEDIGEDLESYPVLGEHVILIYYN